MTRRYYTSADLAILKGNLGAKLPAPAPRKKRSQEESIMQRALLKWWHLQHKVIGVPEILLFSIPNGGARTAITGAILKAEGARKGAPDLMLAVGRGVTSSELDAIDGETYLGLFLELKRRNGVVSPEQEVFHQHLRAQGYKVEVVRTLQDAINIITAYLTT